MEERKYINGSNMLLAIGDKAVGSAQEHTVSYDTETKDHAVKPVESAPIEDSLFKETTVTGLSISISFKGFRVENESELTFEALQAMWKAGQPVSAACYKRPAEGVQDGNRKPYLKAKFIITKLSETATADDDVTYDGELRMTGAPETWTPTVAS